MYWTVLLVIGIMAYAISGALVAIEAEYSFIGVYVLGLVTSFGGAVIRNILIEAPISDIWESTTIMIVFVTLTIIVFLPVKWTQHWRKWGYFVDSIGLATFAIQGALAAKGVTDHIGFLMLAAMFTGLGGGMIRDLLAGNKPLALKEEIHAVLTMICAIYVWLDWTNPLQLTMAVFIVVTIRMTAVKFNLSFKVRKHLPSEESHTS